MKWELDEETGLYYYVARYLDPKYSRWLSGDPAITDYMSGSDAGEEVRWDEDDGHWHRLNPDKSSNKKYPYLDKDGKPVKKRSPNGHIQPNPKPSTNGFDWNNVPMATKNKFILEDKYEATFA